MSSRARTVFDSPAVCAVEADALEKIRADCPAFAGFESVDALAKELKGPTMSFERKDELLLCLVVRYQSSASFGDLALLSRVMRPALGSLFKLEHKRHPDNAPGETEADVQSAFADAVAAYPVGKLRAKVAANLAGRTRKALAQDAKQTRCRNAARRFGRPHVRTLEGETFNLLAHAKRNDSPPVPYDGVDAAVARERLSRVIDEGVLTEEEASLLIQRFILRRTIRQIASETGAKYDALQKRQRRAIKKLRSHPDLLRLVDS